MNLRRHCSMSILSVGPAAPLLPPALPLQLPSTATTATQLESFELALFSLTLALCLFGEEDDEEEEEADAAAAPPKHLDSIFFLGDDDDGDDGSVATEEEEEEEGLATGMESETSRNVSKRADTFPQAAHLISVYISPWKRSVTMVRTPLSE